MNKLPLEVALLISNHLSIREKQECARTCRTWCQYIRSNGLFEKVSLHAAVNEDYLPMIQFFQDTNFGKSVLDLSIHVTTIMLQDFVRLPGIFPNITTLHWVGDIPINSKEDKATFEATVREWKHMRSIDDGSTSHQIIDTLLADTSTAAQLEDIKLVYPIIQEEDEDFDNSDWVPPIDLPLELARNAHSLTAVNLRITPGELRGLWHSLNQFTNLTLLNVDYSKADDEDIADEIERDIIEDYRSRSTPEDFESWRNQGLECPPGKVRHMEVTVDMAKFDMYYLSKWTKYFSESCLNLESFTFKCADPAIPPAINQESYYDPEFMYQNKTLKKYCMQFSRLSQYLLESMEEYKIALEELSVFVDGRSTDQFVHLRNSSQIKTIKKLTIVEREKYIINGVYGLDMLRLMESIPQLEEVEIDTFRGSLLQHNPTVIVSVLNSAPLIKTLKAPALMSRSSNELAVLSQPCELMNLKIAYCQFKLTTLGAQNINQTFKNIMDSCPFLETFSTQVNAYKDETSTDTNIALVFSFTEQPDMKSIQIKSLYETYFKFIINGKTTCYHQKHGEMRRPVPNVDETKVYIQIEARNASIIDTSVMSETP